MFDNLPQINYIAVIVAAIASVGLMAIWYGLLFGKKWMALSGQTEKQPINKLIRSYAIYTAGTIITSFVLANIIPCVGYFLDITGYEAGIITGIAVWLGFYATVTLGSVLWQGRSWKIWLINNGYNVIVIVGMSVIISVWPAK